MQINLHKYIWVWAIGWYVICWLLLHPILGFMLDSDATAYLTIAEACAKGNWERSVNGLWSPLQSWLLAPIIRYTTLDAWQAAKLLNGLIGLGLLILAYRLMLFFTQKVQWKILYVCVFPVILTYFVYFQMFGDVLQVLLLLCYLFIVLHKQFFHSYLSLVLAVLIIGLGFYAKAYTVFFFALHWSFIHYWAWKKNIIYTKVALFRWGLGGILMLLIILPWSVALTQKYGKFSLAGHAGVLNMSWQINSGKSFKSDIQLLIPPTYTNSPSFWEDPYVTQDNLVTPFSSITCFIKWVARVIFTFFQSLACWLELSYLSLFIILLAFIKLWPLRMQEAQSTLFNLQICLFTLLILPLGYIMMHIETRYIWLNVFLLWYIGIFLLDSFLPMLQTLQYKLIQVLFVLSFIYFPLTQIVGLRFKNKDLFERAQAINHLALQGSFTANTADAGRWWVVAYLTHHPFYTIEKKSYPMALLVQEMKKYKVKYYMFEAENDVLSDETSLRNYFSYVAKIPGCTIYQLK